MDCAGVCEGDAIIDECGICNGDGLSCILLGDLNQDGEINVVDIVLLVGIILEPDNPPSDIEFTAGDYNQDGEINVVDIVQLVQLILD